MHADHDNAADAGAAGLAGESFTIEVHPERDLVRVVPGGELDLNVADDLEQRLRQLHNDGFRRFVLDLRRLTFMDSTGLHLILRWDAHARRNGISFDLIQGPRPVQRVFEVTGADQRLSFVG